MIRLIAAAVVSLIADAIALIVAAQVLYGMSLSAGGFALALVLFAVAGLLVQPLLRQVAVRNAPALLGAPRSSHAGQPDRGRARGRRVAELGCPDLGVCHGHRVGRGLGALACVST